MRKLWEAKGEPCILKVTIRTGSPQNMALNVYHAYKPNTYYSQQEAPVNGQAVVYIRLPQVSDRAFFEIYNTRNGNVAGGQDKSFGYSVEQIPLITRPIAFDKNINDFIPFSQWFAENAGILSAGGPFTDRSIYKSIDGKFAINYLDELIDDDKFILDQNNKIVPNQNYGKTLPTSYRIHSETGGIEASKMFVKDYTVPQRMALQMHEGSHFYKNRNPRDEFEADGHALNYCLSLGYGRREIGMAFNKVFLRYPSDQNVARMKYIMNYIRTFDSDNLELV